MGCTDSSVVAENPNKIKPVHTFHQEQSVEHYLIGEVSPNNYVSFNLRIQNDKQSPLVFSKRTLPLLVAGDQPQKLKLPNFAQMTRINNSNIYILSGGINFKLDHIYSKVYLFNANLNKLYPISNLNQARYTHSAVYINSSIYVIGGRYFGDDQQALLSKCERIKFQINQNSTDEEIQKKILQANSHWDYIAEMNVKRCSHVSLIYNNRIYAIGGYTGERQRSCLIQYFDLKQNKTDKWVSLAVNLPFGLESFSAISKTQNQLTIFGGNANSGPMDTVLTLNLSEGCESIVSKSKMKTKKFLHKTYEFEQSIYILGGTADLELEIYQMNRQEEEEQITKPKKKTIYKNLIDKSIKSQQQFEALTHSSNTLTVTFKKENIKSQYERSKNDEIAYIFGTDTEPFILQLNISVPYAICHPIPLTIKVNALQGVVYLTQTRQYILFGGISDSQEDISNDTYIYNPDQSTKKSRLVGKMLTPRYAFSYQRIGQWVYAIGGGTSDEQGDLVILNKCQRMNVKNLIDKSNKNVEWTNIADLPYGIISPMSVNHGNKLYVFGGMKGNKQRYQNIAYYNESINKWQQMKFKFSFGLEGSAIFNKSKNQYWIFGGRVVNGDSKNIWGLTFISNDEDCVFEQKGQMKEAKCLHHVYKPKNQDFIIVLGGEKQVLSFYDKEGLKPIQSDILAGMKGLFTQSLATLRDKTLKNYTVAIQQ